MMDPWERRPERPKVSRETSALDDPQSHAFSPDCGSWPGADKTCWWCGKTEAEHRHSEEHEREFSSDDYDHPIEAAKDFKDRLLAEHGVDRPPPSDHPDDPETWRPCLASATAEPRRNA